MGTSPQRRLAPPASVGICFRTTPRPGVSCGLSMDCTVFATSRPYWREEVVAAWLAVGKDVAVVSHESALDLYELSDVIPNAVHLTIPRSKRYLRPPPDVAVHTTTEPLQQSEILSKDGMRVTTPTRSIVDAAESGTAMEQIEMAVAQALDRGLTTERRLRTAAASRSKRVIQLIDRAIEFARA